jgi:hypothetical protein
MELLGKASSAALRSSCYHKWKVHRRTRPEEVGGRLHRQLVSRFESGLDPSVFASAALEEVRRKTGSFLLPQSYPEGCPVHPAYPGGHAAIAAACITILKAFFDEDAVIPNPVIPSRDGQTLLPYIGHPLTVGGELNKLAANICMGRNAAGIHWRSDAEDGLVFGEDLAIDLLREVQRCVSEPWTFTIRRLSGEVVTV